MHFEKPVARTALAAVSLLLACTVVHAQRPGGPPPPPPPPPAMSGPGPGGPGAPGGPMGGPGGPHGRPLGAGGPLQLGPAGRWWDNNNYAKSIGLKHEQQQRMDAVFDANKTTLFNTFRTLKTEEDKLDMLQRAESPDEDAILKQIDTVSALRGQLQKQSTTLALALRKELTPDQVQQLESAK